MCSPGVGPQFPHALGQMQDDLESNYLGEGKPRIVTDQEETHSCAVLWRNICSDSQIFESRTTVRAIKHLGCATNLPLGHFSRRQR